MNLLTLASHFLCCFSVVCFLSCTNPKKKQETERQKSALSIVKKHTEDTAIEDTLKNKIASWKEYQSLNEFMNRYHAISANEALNNALELASLVKRLKDSIRPKDLITAPFKTRIHVLENETLRLKDMTYIPAITEKEVHHQVDKILEAFSATNSKINTVYTQLEIEKELENFTNTALKSKNGF